jgi:hypothetical protein
MQGAGALKLARSRNFGLLGSICFSYTFSVISRYYGFAGNTRLAKTTGIGFYAEAILYVLQSLLEISITLHLVVALFGDCSGGASPDAFAAFPAGEKKAVLMMVRIGSESRFYGDLRNYTPAAYCFANGGYETVAQAKCAQA